MSRYRGANDDGEGTGMAHTVIIDLDLPDPLEEEERPRPSAIGRRRLISLAALALLCVAAFGGAARTPEPALTYLGAIDWPRGALRQGRPATFAGGLVITEVGGEIFAHHPDGRPAWQARPGLDLSQGPRATGVYRWEDSILLVQSTLRIGSVGAQTANSTSIALDPATGRERWRLDGQPERVGDLVMMTRDRLDGTRDRSIYRRLPDGLLWTVPAARMAMADTAKGALLTLTEQGLLTEYELRTGNVRQTAQLQLPRLAAGEDEVSMVLFRDRLILRAVKYSGPELAVRSLSYDRATLRPLAPSPLDRFFSVEECGPVLCASTFEQTHILDKDTLAELWRTEPGEFPVWSGGALVVRAGSVRLLDPRTGRELIDARGWSAVYDLRPPSSDHETLPLLVTQQLDERTYVARLTPDAIHVLGSIPQRIVRCEHHGGLLVCGLGGDRTGIWRLTAPESGG